LDLENEWIHNLSVSLVQMFEQCFHSNVIETDCLDFLKKELLEFIKQGFLKFESLEMLCIKIFGIKWIDLLRINAKAVAVKAPNPFDLSRNGRSNVFAYNQY